jgi:cell division protein FtsL
MTAVTPDRSTDRRTERRDRPSRRGAAVPRHAYATSGAAAVAMVPERVPQPDPAPVPRPRPAERPNHLRVVAPSERVRRRLTPGMAVLLTAGLFATLLAVAVAHTVLVEGQVHLDALDAQLVAEQARYQELRTEVAQLESPERIVQAANEMGMVTPEDLQYLTPPAPDVSAVEPTGDDDEPAADPTVGDEPERTWADVKALLEAPAP